LTLSQAPLYPLTFTPILKDYVWGGRSFESLFRRRLPAGVIAESWEIAAHADGNTVVDAGYYQGLSLAELTRELGPKLVGSNARWSASQGKFPLLIKLLDAANHLSVQVHPHDAYARKNERGELGKTEMWVVLDASPDAAVILGVKSGTTPESFRQAINEGTLASRLHRIPISKGDVVCIPSGSVHAILGGSVLAEIQQNSNTTYRVFDWNRLQDGKPRQLHIDKAMDVINFEQVEPGLCQPEFISENGGILIEQLCSNRHFVTERLQMREGSVFIGDCDGSTLEIWGVIEGEAAIHNSVLPAVRFALLPAALGKYSVLATKTSTLLRTYLQPG